MSDRQRIAAPAIRVLLLFEALMDYDFGREKLSSVCARLLERRHRYKQRAKSAVVPIRQIFPHLVTTFETSAEGFFSEKVYTALCGNSFTKHLQN